MRQIKDVEIITDFLILLISIHDKSDFIASVPITLVRLFVICSQMTKFSIKTIFHLTLRTR